MTAPQEAPIAGLRDPMVNAVAAFRRKWSFKTHYSFSYLCFIFFGFLTQKTSAESCVCGEDYKGTIFKRGHAAAGNQNGGDKLRDLVGIASYAPIALYAESLRVPKALVQSIITPRSVSPCLTGCIKDIEWLWNLNAQRLFGSPGHDTDSYVTASVRHGNEFPLANTALLRMIKLIERPSHRVFFRPTQGESSRPTTVNVTFLTPPSRSKAVKSGPRKQTRQLVAVLLVVVLQLAVQLSAAVIAVLHESELECILLVIPSINVVLLSIIRLVVEPKFALAGNMVKDTMNTYRGGAKIDAHIVSRNWNSSHIDVFCGYSSHLHSLTNIPVQVTREHVLTWVSRLLALTLSTQAAALAYVVGRTGTFGLAALIWLVMYVVMLLPQMLLERAWPMGQYETHIGAVEFAGTAIFSNRRPALAFLAMLPVSYKVKRWDWVNVFMPENERRIEWQKDLETCLLIGGSTMANRRVSKEAEFHLEQAQKAYGQLRKNGSLDRFEKAIML